MTNCTSFCKCRLIRCVCNSSEDTHSAWFPVLQVAAKLSLAVPFQLYADDGALLTSLDQLKAKDKVQKHCRSCDRNSSGPPEFSIKSGPRAAMRSRLRHMPV